MGQQLSLNNSPNKLSAIKAIKNKDLQRLETILKDTKIENDDVELTLYHYIIFEVFKYNQIETQNLIKILTKYRNELNDGIDFNKKFKHANHLCLIFKPYNNYNYRIIELDDIDNQSIKSTQPKVYKKYDNIYFELNDLSLNQLIIKLINMFDDPRNDYYISVIPKFKPYSLNDLALSNRLHLIKDELFC